MSNFKYEFGSYSIDDNTVPVPENLKEKDARADSVARVAVFSATEVINKVADMDFTSLNVIVLNREGCDSYVKKISDGISKKTPRQGFFARGGPQTLATYTALALGCHGSAFTIVGEKDALNEAITSAIFLAKIGTSSGTILTVVAKTNSGGFKAKSVLIMAKNNKFDLLNQEEMTVNDIYNNLIRVFNMESKQ